MKISARTKGALKIVFGLSLVFALFGAIGIVGWEYSNSDAFCADACHNVHPEEPFAHQASQHANVNCVECHMGRLATFQTMKTKVSHSKHLWGVIMGYERPLTAPSMPTSRDSCEGCHSKQSHQHDSIRTHKHYAADAASTETSIQLVMRTAAGHRRAEGGRGIHWHSDEGNQVRFISTDPQNQNIPWVEVTYPDGEKVVFNDISQPLSADEVARSEKRLMECVDCHNRTGHHFVNPEAIIDDAIASGWLDRSQPYIKARVREMLTKEYSTIEEARQVVEAAYEQYVKDFPDVARDFPEELEESKEYVLERQEAYANWLVRSRFRHPDVSWQSFQDLSGHKYTAGCFRCHGGRHSSDQGKPISANCTTCHNVPSVRRESDPAVTRVFAERVSLDNPVPESHKTHEFILSHREMEGRKICSTCHDGAMKHGVDNSSFCSNPACHDTVWPGLDLPPLTLSKNNE